MKKGISSTVYNASEKISEFKSGQNIYMTERYIFEPGLTARIAGSCSMLTAKRLRGRTTDFQCWFTSTVFFSSKCGYGHRAEEVLN